jgi:glycosyltransferase involved in cell wall biosynthesis
MKVLIFSESFYPHGGGAEFATRLYSQLLAENGFEVSVITKQFPNEPCKELLFGKIKIYRYPFRVFNDGRYFSFVNANIMTTGFVNKAVSETDLVYIPGSWYSAIIAAKLRRKPVVIHMHNNALTCPTSLMYDFVQRDAGKSSGKSFMLHEMIQRRRKGVSVAASCFANVVFGGHVSRLLKSANAIIFVSKAQLHLTLSRFPSLSEKSFMVYNPIPDYPMQNSENIGIGYLGGKNYVKGYYHLIKAIAKLPPELKAHVHLAMATLTARKDVLRNGVEINSYPKLNREGILNLMKSLSVVVVPSLNPEPFPYALIEAMLCGKIVVASNLGGIPEIVEGAGQGVELVNPESTNDLAECLSRAVGFSLEDAQKIGRQNRELIIRKFSNDLAIKSLISIMDRVS